MVGLNGLVGEQKDALSFHRPVGHPPRRVAPTASTEERVARVLTVAPPVGFDWAVKDSIVLIDGHRNRARMTKTPGHLKGVLMEVGQ